MPYLSERALDGLKHYKYKPGGYTWLDDLHQPFWNCALATVSPSAARHPCRQPNR